MKLLTFTQKLLRQRYFFSSLIPLMALFVGLGTSFTTLAQSAINTTSVNLTTLQSGVTTTQDYNTQTGTAGPTNLAGKDFGTFNLAADQFTLNGGTVTATENGDTFDQGELLFRVFPGTLTMGTPIAFTSLALVNGGALGGVRTFTLSAANRNLLALAVQGSMSGASNRFDVRFRVTDNIGGGSLSSTIRSSVFTSIGSPVPPTNISNTTVILDTTQVSVGSPPNPNTNENMSFNLKPNTPQPFQGAVLGGIKGYEINSGKLFLNGGTASTFESGGDQVTAVILFYRVFKQGSTPSIFKSFALATDGTVTGGVRTFGLNTAQQNLITSNLPSSGIGTFIVQVYLEANVTRPGPVFNTIKDDNGGINYTATFTAKGIPVITTTWISTTISAAGQNWLNTANWSAGVPNRNTNAIIPAKDETVPVTSTPTLNDPSALYEVQNLTLNGGNNSNRGLVRIGQSTGGGTTLGASLRVYGDLNNTAAGILAGVSGGVDGIANPLINSTLIFAGDALSTSVINGVSTPTGGNQRIIGLTNAVDVRVEGTGVKAVFNTLSTQSTLTFAPGISALLRTVDLSGNYTSSQSSIVDLGTSGFLIGETNTAYVDGITKSNHPLLNSVTETFGNIGVDITTNRDVAAPNVIVTRTIGDPFTNAPTGTAKGIKRQYGVTGDVNNSPTLSTVVFHYLDSANELNTNPENNLVIFRTGNNGVPFAFVGGVRDIVANTVTKDNMRPINTITLGDRLNPLPVTLTSFDAKRVGSDALLTWETASELDNKGFSVQVSNDGKEFRTIGFVASTAPNTTRATKYSYTDTEKNKVSLRYYRLQQEDVDGKTAFFAPRIVSFEGKLVKSSGLLAYPNPFTSEVNLVLNSDAVGKALVRVTDMTGRTVAQSQVSLVLGSNDVPSTNMRDLKAGIYLMHVTLPNGTTENMKVVKQ